MSRRTDRIGSLVRETLGQLMLAKLSDPRIDPARTSITHVDVSEDLLTAKVFVSVIGTDAEQRTALRALQSAGGRLQDLMMRQITLRNTPILQFVADTEFKKTLETLKVIEQAMAEIRLKEDTQDEQDGQDGDEQDGDEQDGDEQDTEQ